MEFVNGMQASALVTVTWIKSSHSNATGNCVEMAALPGDRIAIRNSRDPHGRRSSAHATSSRGSWQEPVRVVSTR